jgi:hypothetical protein
VTVLDAFRPSVLGDFKGKIRSMLKDPHISRRVTYNHGPTTVNHGTGTAPAGAKRYVRTIGGPTQDRHTGQWSVGTRTYLIACEDFLVPKPARAPARGDWIEEQDGGRWKIENVDHGDLGEPVYYVLQARGG